jgi:hypothetical protein
VPFAAVAGVAFLASIAVAFATTAYRFSEIGSLIEERMMCEIVISAKKPQFLGANAKSVLFDAVLSSSSDDGLKADVRRHTTLSDKDCSVR